MSAPRTRDFFALAVTLRRLTPNGRIDPAETFVAIAEAITMGVSPASVAQAIGTLPPVQREALRVAWNCRARERVVTTDQPLVPVVLAIREAWRSLQGMGIWLLPDVAGHEAFPAIDRADRLAELLRQVCACPQAAPWLNRVTDPTTGKPLWQAIGEAVAPQAVRA